MIKFTDLWPGTIIHFPSSDKKPIKVISAPPNLIVVYSGLDPLEPVFARITEEERPGYIKILNDQGAEIIRRGRPIMATDLRKGAIFEVSASSIYYLKIKEILSRGRAIVVTSTIDPESPLENVMRIDEILKILNDYPNSVGPAQMVREGNNDQ